MTTLHYEFDDGDHWQISYGDLERYRDFCLVQVPQARPFSDRIAMCLWLELYALQHRYDIQPRDLLQPIIDVEAGDTAVGIKPATQFRRKPLKGLWHKHWTNPRFMAANLLAAMERGNPEQWIFELVKEGELLTEEALGKISNRFTTGAYEDRWAAKQITGEWIIFLKRGGLNYYLCHGTHHSGDERLYDKIRTMCVLDFPDIDQWLADAASGQ